MIKDSPANQHIHSCLSNARWNLEKVLKGKTYPRTDKDQCLINAHADICEAMRTLEGHTREDGNLA